MGEVVRALEVDGRTARRDRNRELVLDAVLDLFAEDALAPTAQQVAQRSGVSLRSVYRYFEDTDALVRSAIDRNLERVRPLFMVEDLGLGPVEGRAGRLVASRLTLHDRVGPLMRATILHAGDNAVLAARLAAVRRLMGEQVEQMFAPELSGRPSAERREVAAVADELLTYESIEHLRRVRGLSRAATERTLVRSLLAVLA